MASGRYENLKKKLKKKEVKTDLPYLSFYKKKPETHIFFFGLGTVSLDKFCCILLNVHSNSFTHVEVAICLSKPQKYLLYICQVFLGGRRHEQIFLVQKLACLALKQGF